MYAKRQTKNRRRLPETDLNPGRGRRPGRKIGKLRQLSIREAHHAAADFTEAIDRMRKGRDPDGDCLSHLIRNYAYKIGFHDRAFCEKAMSELRKLSRWALVAASAA
jgi:hypothetical protein